jgi:hypothetical protein
MQRQSSVFAARLFLVFEEVLKILRLRHQHQAGTLLLFTESFGKSEPTRIVLPCWTSPLPLFR